MFKIGQMCDMRTNSVRILLSLKEFEPQTMLLQRMSLNRYLRNSVFHRNLNREYPVITRGEGVYLFDDTGKKYLDGSSGAVVSHLGHTNPEIAEAIREQAHRVGFAHTLRFETEQLYQLAEMITGMLPKALSRVFFASGGSEANESAIKLSRQYHALRGDGAKTKIIGRTQSYHGNTIGSLSVGGDTARRELYRDFLIPSLHIRTPRENELATIALDELAVLIQQEDPKTIAALILEPIVGSQLGAMVPPERYLEGVQKICSENDILLIVDEVMTGFGRTGNNFAIEHFGITPDILTFGKAVSAGYAPLSGMVVHEKVTQVIAENDGIFKHGYTYSGHPISIAAGIAAVKKFQELHLLENVKRMGEVLLKGLQNIAQTSGMIQDVRGMGLIIGFDLSAELDMDSEAFNQRLMEEGLVLYPGKHREGNETREHVLVAPPLIISEKEVTELLSLIGSTIEKIRKQKEAI